MKLLLLSGLILFSSATGWCASPVPKFKDSFLEFVLTNSDFPAAFYEMTKTELNGQLAAAENTSFSVDWEYRGTEVELSISDGSKEILRKVRGSKFNWNLFFPGQTYTVRIRETLPQLSDWSAPIEVRVLMSPPIIVPGDVRFDYLPAERKFSYSLVWKKQLFDPRYEIQFLGAQGREVHFNSKENAFTYKDDRGDWQNWRVRTLNEKDQAISDWSRPYPLPKEIPFARKLVIQELFSKRRWTFQAGLGIAGVQSAQKVEALSSDLKWSSANFSDLHFELGRFLGERFESRLDYDDTQVKVSPGDQINLTGTSSRWTLLEGSLLYHSNDLFAWSNTTFSRWFLGAKFQKETLPYLSKQGLIFSLASRDSNNFLMGGGLRLGPVSKGILTLEAYFGEQISSGTRFTEVASNIVEVKTVYLRRLGDRYSIGGTIGAHLESSSMKDSQLQSTPIVENNNLLRAQILFGFDW